MEKLCNFFGWAPVFNFGGKIPVLIPLSSYLQHVHLSSAWIRRADGLREITVGLLSLAASCLCPGLQLIAPVMGQGENAKLCLQAAYLFHSPAALHLFRCCSGVHTGVRFFAVSASQKMFGLWGVFYYYFRIFPLLISLFYSQSLQVLH